MNRDKQSTHPREHGEMSAAVLLACTCSTCSPNSEGRVQSGTSVEPKGIQWQNKSAGPDMEPAAAVISGSGA